MSHLIPKPLQPLFRGSLPADLPLAVPLDLAELPIVQSAKALRYEADNQLSPECLAVEGSFDAGAFRMRYRISSADPNVPLPYGSDSEILYALLEMVRQDRGWEVGHPGRLDRVPFTRFAEILGTTSTGPFNNRVRGALQRLASVHIATQIVQVEADDVDPILSGEGLPKVPRTRKRTTESRLHLLSVSYSDDGSSIEYIQLDPTWVYQGVTGWTAWLHLPLYVSLTSPVAQRLYNLVAVQCARGKHEWSYSQDDLVALCALSPRAPSYETRRTLNQAIKVLESRGVLSRGEAVKERPGQYRFDMAAGPALASARLLRGAGMADLKDTLVQIAILGAIGITGAEARRIVSQAPDDAYWALYYYRWTLETQPEAEQIRNPARFLMWAVREGSNLAANREFYQWFQRETAPPQQAEPAVRPKPVAPPSVVALPRPIPAGATAEALWQKIRERVELEGKLPGLSVALLRHVVGSEEEGDTLWCLVGDGYPTEAFRSDAKLAEIARCAELATDGQITRIVIETENEAARRRAQVAAAESPHE